MKSYFFILTLLLLVSCGKKEVVTNKAYDTAALSATGVNFAPNRGGGISVFCIETYGVTNQQRMNELIQFKSSIGLGSKKTVDYTYAGITLTPQEMDKLLSDAIQSLQGSSYGYGNVACPREVLAYTLKSTY